MRLNFKLLILILLLCSMLNAQEIELRIDSILSYEFHLMKSTRMINKMSAELQEKWYTDRLQFVCFTCEQGELSLDTIYGEGFLELSYIEMNQLESHLNEKQKCSSGLEFIYSHLASESKLDGYDTFLEFEKEKILQFIKKHELDWRIRILPRVYSRKINHKVR